MPFVVTGVNGPFIKPLLNNNEVPFLQDLMLEELTHLIAWHSIAPLMATTVLFHSDSPYLKLTL